MLDIEAPSFQTPDATTTSAASSPQLLENTLIQLLIQPLEKRFKFHFCTARKTNNLDKVKTLF